MKKSSPRLRLVHVKAPIEVDISEFFREIDYAWIGKGIERNFQNTKTNSIKNIDTYMMLNLDFVSYEFNEERERRK